LIALPEVVKDQGRESQSGEDKAEDPKIGGPGAGFRGFGDIRKAI
jgi:hypothetical protein